MKKASLKQKGDSIFLGRDGSGFGRASTRFEAKASADLIEATFKPFVAQRAGGKLSIGMSFQLA